MPLWHVYHPTACFSTLESKKALSASLTRVYTDAGLPAFYVGILFHPLPLDSMFIGGETRSAQEKPFVRLVGEHIAIHQKNNDAAYATVTARIDRALKPHIQAMGYDWEYHVDETERRLWKLVRCPNEQLLHFPSTTQLLSFVYTDLVARMD